ncbi:MAG TPA: hypothetical protein VH591_22115 [Ktedonobacterales bacterium]
MHRSSRLFRSVSSSRQVKTPRIRSTALLVVGAVCLLGALALAGCGVTTTNVGGGGDGSQPTATSGINNGGTMSVRPCPGNSVASNPAATIVLTVKDSYKTTQAHVGDTIEVQLDTKTHWASPAHDAAPALAAIQPQGGMDEATQTCQWFYTAAAPGKVTLDFTGAPLCESNAPCPAIARAEQFTIQVS